MSYSITVTVHPASTPPEGTPGCWTRKVCVILDTGEVQTVSYFTPTTPGNPGMWQRLRGTPEHVRVVRWFDILPKE